MLDRLSFIAIFISYHAVKSNDLLMIVFGSFGKASYGQIHSKETPNKSARASDWSIMWLHST
jgi:hypothetical protein